MKKVHVSLAVVGVLIFAILVMVLIYIGDYSYSNSIPVSNSGYTQIVLFFLTIVSSVGLYIALNKRDRE